MPPHDPDAFPTVIGPGGAPPPPPPTTPAAPEESSPDDFPTEIGGALKHPLHPPPPAPPRP